MRAALPIAIALSSVFVGCRTEVKLGPPANPVGSGGGGPGTPPDTFAPFCVPSVTQPGPPWQDQPDYVGYPVTASIAPATSELVRLVRPTSSQDGWIMFGASDTRPKATPQDLCYPTCDTADMPGEAPGWHEGVKYPLHLERKRMAGPADMVSIPLYEPWRDWCAMRQTVRQAPGDGYACSSAPDARMESPTCAPSDGGTVPSGACCLETLCHTFHVCACTAEGCEATSGKVEIPLFQVGDQLVLVLNNGTAISLDPVRTESPGAPPDAGLGDPVGPLDPDAWSAAFDAGMATDAGVARDGSPDAPPSEDAGAAMPQVPPDPMDAGALDADAGP